MVSTAELWRVFCTTGEGGGSFIWTGGQPERMQQAGKLQCPGRKTRGCIYCRDEGPLCLCVGNEAGADTLKTIPKARAFVSISKSAFPSIHASWNFDYVMHLRYLGTMGERGAPLISNESYEMGSDKRTFQEATTGWKNLISREYRLQQPQRIQQSADCLLAHVTGQKALRATLATKSASRTTITSRTVSDCDVGKGRN